VDGHVFYLAVVHVHVPFDDYTVDYFSGVHQHSKVQRYERVVKEIEATISLHATQQSSLLFFVVDVLLMVVGTVKLEAQAGLYHPNREKHQEHVPSQKKVDGSIIKRFLLLVGALVHNNFGIVARIKNEHKNSSRVFYLTTSWDELHRTELYLNFFSPFVY